MSRAAERDARRPATRTSSNAVYAALRLGDAVPPSGGAAVMGTGIVSIGLARVGHQTLSQILLAIAVGLWLGLLATFVQRALRQCRRWLREARTPGSLTVVAGTCVLGTRLTLLGEEWAGCLLLAVGACLLLVLLPPVLRHWITPTAGASFMLTVAPESLVVLAALLAIDDRRAWLAEVALGPLALGLAAYAFVLARLGSPRGASQASQA